MHFQNKHFFRSLCEIHHSAYCRSSRVHEDISHIHVTDSCQMYSVVTQSQTA